MLGGSQKWGEFSPLNSMGIANGDTLSENWHVGSHWAENGAFWDSAKVSKC